MEFEIILKNLERRNPDIMKCDLILCTKFIMEHKNRNKFEEEILN